MHVQSTKWQAAMIHSALMNSTRYTSKIPYRYRMGNFDCVKIDGWGSKQVLAMFNFGRSSLHLWGVISVKICLKCAVPSCNMTVCVCVCVCVWCNNLCMCGGLWCNNYVCVTRPWHWWTGGAIIMYVWWCNNYVSHVWQTTPACAMMQELQTVYTWELNAEN